METRLRDSGAGAYSNGEVMGDGSVEGEVVGACVAAGGELRTLHQHVVQKARRAEPPEIGREPLGRGLVHDDEVANGVLRVADAAGNLDTDPVPGGVGEVTNGLEHHESDRRR